MFFSVTTVGQKDSAAQLWGVHCVFFSFNCRHAVEGTDVMLQGKTEWKRKQGLSCVFCILHHVGAHLKFVSSIVIWQWKADLWDKMVCVQRMIVYLEIMWLIAPVL